MVKQRTRMHLWGQSPLMPLNRLLGLSPQGHLNRFFALGLMLFAVSAQAVMREGDAQPAPGAQSSSFRLRDVPFEFMLGPVILKGEAGAGLAARAPLPRGFELELGGLIPHRVSDYADDQTISGSGVTTDGHVRSFGELHFGLLYPLYKEKHLRADVGAGCSLGFIKNEFRQAYAAPSTTVLNGASRHTALSPWLQTSASYFFTDHVAFRLQVAYMRYNNSANFNQSGLDLDFSGVMISPMLVWRM